jgi:CDP-paratose 2-epimerase
MSLVTGSAPLRLSDHIWWVSDVRKFQSHYPEWWLTYDIRATLTEVYGAMRVRIRQPVAG